MLARSSCYLFIYVAQAICLKFTHPKGSHLSHNREWESIDSIEFHEQTKPTKDFQFQTTIRIEYMAVVRKLFAVIIHLEGE